MSIKNFKNPWAEGGEYYPDWLGGEKALSSLNNESSSNISSTKSALIYFGRGAELGDFSIFCEALKKNHLSKKFKNENIFIVKTFSRNELVDAILNSGLSEITELHIFSHAAGPGLFLGYHDPTFSKQRQDFLAKYPNPTYEQVVNNEVASLLTDHLVVMPSAFKFLIQQKLKHLSLAKLWGCNTGISDWVYDSSAYWNPLNTKNIPKPSMAQAFATFINKTVYGASSGSHIEYFVKGKWLSGYDYTPISTKDYSDIRLHPDIGNYDAYRP
jgi:hypothetical protein